MPFLPPLIGRTKNNQCLKQIFPVRSLASALHYRPRSRSVEATMGANSTQGFAVLLFLVAFTFLSAALFGGGSLMFLLLFVVTAGASVAVFLKVKPLEHAER